MNSRIVDFLVFHLPFFMGKVHAMYDGTGRGGDMLGLGLRASRRSSSHIFFLANLLKDNSGKKMWNGFGNEKMNWEWFGMLEDDDLRPQALGCLVVKWK